MAMQPTPHLDPAPATGRKYLPLALALIALVTIAVYWPVLQNGFITYDDTDYVTANPMVQQGLTAQSLGWAFSAFHAGNWHPLTWLSHMLDVELFGMSPAGHHGTGLLLHAANALLLCVLFYRLTGAVVRSALVALLFALHPLHVESVAWVAERKDVLSTFFWLSTMLAYLRYAARPSLPRYAVVLLLFALGLMAKQMLVTLPVVLLLVDYWPLRRAGTDAAQWKPLVLEKMPLLALAGGAAAVTMQSQKAAGALGAAGQSSILLQSGNALISYVEYLRKMVFPHDLALFYPLDPAAVTPAKVAACALILAVLTAAALWQLRRRPYLAFGWLWYLVTLLPVIGFIRIGSQALADRYSYIPLVGPFLIIVWGVHELASRRRNGAAIACAAALGLLVVLSALTVRQVGYWKDSFTLYSRALSVVPDNWLAHNNLGILLAQGFRTQEAIGHFRESVRLNPEGAEGYRNLGNAYQMVGRSQEAMQAFREAVSINPDDAESRFRLGYAYLMSGNLAAAQGEAQELLRLDERRARPLLDSIRMQQGR